MGLSRKPITATLEVRDRHGAEMAFFLYEEITQNDLPYDQATWAKSIQSYPVEIYLIFPNKRLLGRYLREISQSGESVKVVSSYLDGEE